RVIVHANASPRLGCLDYAVNNAKRRPTPPADYVTRPRRDDRAGISEEALPERVRDELGTGLGAAVGVAAAESIVLGERAAGAVVIVNLVARHNDRGPHARHPADGLQQIRGSHPVGSVSP